MGDAVPDVLALIGARSGSRGLPGKNVRPLGGHPLLAWSIAAARRASRVGRVVVSTDAPAYAEIARRYGADVPFLRPAGLAGDTAPDLAYVSHALDVLERDEGYRPDIVLRLLPTVPFQQPSDLDAVVDLLVADPDATSAVVVAAARQHPAKALRIERDAAGRERLVGWSGGGPEPTARQSHGEAYFRANVVAARPDVVRATGTLTGPRAAVHVVPADRGPDIDDELDLLFAEFIVAHLDPARPEPVDPGPSAAHG